MKAKTAASIISLGLSMSLFVGACGSSSDASGDGDTGDGDGDGDAGDGDAGDGDGDAGDGDGDAGDGDAGDGDAGDGDTGDGDMSVGGMTGDGDSPDYPDTTFDYDPTKDTDPATCAATQLESEEIFLDMFVILDKSGSMTRGAPDGDGVTGANDPDGYCDIGDPNIGSRWCNSINALHGFFSDPTSIGMGVSYGEFSTGSCNAFDMDVAFDILQEDGLHLDDIRDAMNDDNPDGGTNTEGAVDTLIAETEGHVPTGTRKTIAILITDGEPSDSCMNNAEEDDYDDGGTLHLSNLNELLVDHLDNAGIPTFVIGVEGVSANPLEVLASGAGAQVHTSYCIAGDDECSYYSVGNGDPAVFMAALEDIRGSVLGCEYAVPEADVGLSNLDTLQVLFTPSSVANEVTLEQVGDEGSCSDDDQYWVDFSGGDDPIIKLCPATCDTRSEGASIDISLKCEGS